MRFYFLLTFLVSISTLQLVYSQSSGKLLQERKELLDQLEEAEEQTSSILGKKSKKDLRNTTDILKDIVNKDSEIITALQREVNRKVTVQQQQTAEVPENDQKIVELENQLANLNNLANQRNIKTAELEQQVSSVQDRMFKYQSTILITFVIIFLLAIYISRLRKKSKLKEQSQ